MEDNTVAVLETMITIEEGVNRYFSNTEVVGSAARSARDLPALLKVIENADKLKSILGIP